MGIFSKEKGIFFSNCRESINTFQLVNVLVLIFAFDVDENENSNNGI